MPKKNLVEIVNEVLDTIKGRQVTSISETNTSQKIARFARTVYENMWVSADWPHTMTLTELESLADVTQPVSLKIPDAVEWFEYLKYDRAQPGEYKQYKDVAYMDPQDFLDLVKSRISTDSNVDTINLDPDGVEIFITNDKMPDYWTSFDDEIVVMDSYDSAVESTLQGAKTTIYAKKEVTWSSTDNFIPPMPSHLFPQYMARLKMVFQDEDNHRVKTTDIQDEQSLSAKRKRRGAKVSGRNQKINYGRK